MADMLKFRKGTYAQINAANKVAGTIYIAKDEKAMYVDIDASTRIRIGDFIRVDSVEGITPPYSTSALYYVEADNALLKYDGSTWKQINGTDDIIQRLSAAEGAISTMEALVGTKGDSSITDTAFGRIAKNDEAIDGLRDYIGTIPDTATANNVIAYIQEKTAGIATDVALTELTGRVTTAEAGIESLNGTVADHTSYLNTLKGTGKGSVAEAKQAGDNALALIGDDNSGLTKIVKANEDYITNTLKGADTLNGSVANAKKAGTDAQATANANAGEIATLKGKVSAIESDYVTESKLATVKSDLQNEIDADIRAANAMEYAGIVSSQSDLPLVAKNGATYVVGSKFGNYAAGDMLIAQGTEDVTTGLITDPTWAHVKTGYDATLDQQLTGANNKIMLSNGIRNDEDAAGAITFASTGSASVEVKDNTVTIGMVWEDFN